MLSGTRMVLMMMAKQTGRLLVECWMAMLLGTRTVLMTMAIPMGRPLVEC
jgi:hypothetical protein